MDKSELKHQIFMQSSALDEANRACDRYEYALLTTESELINRQNQILDNFPGKTSLEEVVNAINGKFNEISEKVDEMEKKQKENQKHKESTEEVLRSLKELNVALTNIQNKISFQETIDKQLNELNEIESLLSK